VGAEGLGRRGFVLAGALLVVRPAWAQAPTVDGILSRFRGVPGLEAHFREEKKMTLLAAPLVSEGTLSFQAPDKVARHTLTPRKASVVIDGHRIDAWDGKKTQRIDVGASPVAAAFVETFGQLLSGDRAGLERTFRIEVANAVAPRWGLTLVPKADPLAKTLKEIRFRGNGALVEALELEERNGDCTTMGFSQVNPHKTFTPEESARVFRLPS
jgi:outer membrane lipoprotein-sorting protein